MINRSSAFAYVSKTLDDGVQSEVCRWVEARLNALGSHIKEVNPRQIASDLNVSTEQDMRNILHVLDVLSLNTVGVLQVAYELYDQDDILGMPVDVPGEDVLNALKTGVLYNPRTGLVVSDYKKSLAVIYRVRAEQK